MIPWDWPAGRYHREQLPQGQSWQCRGVACDWLPNSPCDWSTFWPQRPAAENRIPSPHSRWSSGNAAGWSPSTRRTIMFTAGVCMIGETSKSKLYFESIHPSRLPQEWLLSKTYGCELPDNTDADHLVALTGQLGDVLVNRLLFNKLTQLFSLINIQINISFSATISHTHTQRSWMYISLKRLPGPAVTALCSRYVLCSSVTGLVGEQICCFPSGNLSMQTDREQCQKVSSVRYWSHHIISSQHAGSCCSSVRSEPSPRLEREWRAGRPRPAPGGTDAGTGSSGRTADGPDWREWSPTAGLVQIKTKQLGSYTTYLV